MKRHLCALAAALLTACTSLPEPSSRYSGPVFDMHLHAYEEDAPFFLCIPWVEQFPGWDQSSAWADTFFGAMSEPPCDDPIPPVSAEGGALMRATIAAMEERDMVGVLSGSPEETERWEAAASGRLIRSLEFRLDRDDLSPEDIRTLLETGDFAVVGEISNQYGGIAPNDPRMDPYWALFEELGIPVAIHMEAGVPGVALLSDFGFGNYRSRLGDPYLLEDILVRHPRLRVSVMHYGSPRVNDMIAIMSAYPQVYVDLGGIQWFWPEAYFHQHLRQFVDAGMGKRVMFGSDQGEWVGVIGPSIDIIDRAEFLTDDQKADIFWNNAVRFLRLPEEEERALRERALSSGS